MPASSWERLPCGCGMGTDEATSTFLFEPCSLDCKYYRYVIEEADRQGKPLSTLDLRDQPPAPRSSTR